MISNLDNTKTANILAIDDESINLEILEELLEGNDYSNVTLFSDAEKAIEYYQRTPPDIVLLDLKMPFLSGFDVLQRFVEINYNPMPPVIIITASGEKTTRLKALGNGASDFLSKPFDEEEVLMRVRNLLDMHLAHKKIRDYSQNLELIVQQRTQDLLETQNEMIERLGLAAEYRDNETAAHTIRVGHYAKTIAKQIGLTEKESEQLRLAAPLHDIGKIGISDNILLKPGKLTEEEWNSMKKHAEIGHDILKNSNSLMLKNAGIIALTHHEKWDGSGYPVGLKGDEIHLYGRITAIADVFDALIMSRPYKKAWLVEDAIKLINDQSGKHFDPLIVNAFNQVIEVFLSIKEQYAD